MYSLPAAWSHNASEWVFSRASITTPVFVHVVPLRRWMVNALAELVYMLAHQKPSLNQTLLSGLVPVGSAPEPLNDGPAWPTSPGAARTPVAVMLNSPTIRNAISPTTTGMRPCGLPLLGIGRKGLPRPE